MKEEKNKIITQWMLPTVILIAIVVGMIINFNYRSGEMAITSIAKDLIVVSERYAGELESDLAVMSGLTKVVAEAIYNIEKSDEDTKQEVVNMLNSIYIHSYAYMAIICDDNGLGFTNTGKNVNLSGTSYFSELQELGPNKFIFIENDGIDGSMYKSIIYVNRVPGYNGRTVISYYPIENMGKSIERFDFDGDILYLLVCSDNDQVLAHNKDYVSKFISDDVINRLRRSYSGELRKMDIRLKNGYSDTMKVALDGEERSLVYTPLSMNNWFVMVGINEYFVELLENRVWEFTRRTLFQLAMVISGFAICMVLINMIAKLRHTSKTKELMVKADTDLLTGLLNKVATERRVMDYMEAYPNEQAIMFVLDIDNFKKINDTMGHAFGDEVLRSLGQQITPIFRSTDIIGRIGGDELIILLKNIYNDENLLREAEKVARFFHDFKAGEYVKYSATASIGAAIFPRDGKDFESMYKAADQALYMAKKRGKNQLAFYHDTFDAVVIKN
ncbi:MAG: diguanylate cyclase [Lachnospiraceae bacterium]|nr:diguanylate cyclase [Lachnospiraceae bacterium]